MAKASGTKNALIFLSRASTHDNTAFSFVPWSMRFVPLKLCIEFSIFQFVLFLLKFIFFSTNYKDSLTLKCQIPFKIKIIEKPHTVLLSDLWSLSCNKKFENSVIPTWVGIPQNWPVDKFSKFRKRSFESVSFSQ